MTRQQELQLYKKALIDWEKPIDQAEQTGTAKGFCWYFDCKRLGYFYNSFQRSLPTLYNQRLTMNEDHFHYLKNGKNKECRQQRVTALKNAIEILENELKGEV